jgi:hypothetical protein
VVAATLWSVILGAVVLAAVASARSGQAPERNAPPEPVSARWDVAGFAELFVSTFLGSGEGEEGALATFMGGETPDALAGTVAGDWFASSTSTVSVVEIGDGRWRVTVAAALLRRSAKANEYAALGVRFFDLEVVQSGSGLTAPGLPWMVPSPSTGEPVDDDWGSGSAPSAGDGVADTVERFLQALLTGSGELGRYATSGSGLRSAATTFDTVTLERIAVRDAPTGREVRAWVLAESDGVGLWMVYSLSLVQQEGRWEVAAIGPVPVAGQSPEIPVESVPSSVAGESD